MPRRPTEAGFTLLELMLVILVIGVMTALVAPGLAEQMADMRASSATSDIIRLTQHTRVRAMQTGLAHLLLVNTADVATPGRVRVWEGMNNRCRTTPWAQPLTGVAMLPVEQVDLGGTASPYNATVGGAAPSGTDDAGKYLIALNATFGGAARTVFAICYQPSGTTLTNAAGDGAVFLPHVQPLIVSVVRTIDGVVRGRTRQIAIPPGGLGRAML